MAYSYRKRPGTFAEWLEEQNNGSGQNTSDNNSNYKRDTNQQERTSTQSQRPVSFREWQQKNSQTQDKPSYTKPAEPKQANAPAQSSQQESKSEPSKMSSLANWAKRFQDTTDKKAQEIIDLASEKMAERTSQKKSPFVTGAVSESDMMANMQKESAIIARQQERERQKKQAEYDKKSAAYEKLKGQRDFAENSKYKKSENPLLAENALYEYVNRNEDVKRFANEYGYTGTTGDIGFSIDNDKTFLEQMSDDEIATYNYIDATQGREASTEYLNHLRRQLTAKQREETTEFYEQMADEDPVATSIASAIMSPFKGTAYVGQLADLIATGEIDQNAKYNQAAYANTAVRNKVSQKVEEKYGEVGSFAYQTGMSMADMLVGMGFSGGAEPLMLGIMGAGAASDKVIESKDKGLSDAQAFAIGTIAGGAEIITEKVSIDTLLDNIGKSAGKALLKNMLAEGSEEVGSDLINWIADVAIAKDKSEWKQDIQEYMKQGYSESEAFGLAMGDQAKQMGLSFAGGAVSGGVFGGATSVPAIGSAVSDYFGRSQESTVNYDTELAKGTTATEREEAKKVLDKIAHQKEMAENNDTDAAWNEGIANSSESLTESAAAETETVEPVNDMPTEENPAETDLRRLAEEQIAEEQAKEEETVDAEVEKESSAMGEIGKSTFKEISSIVREETSDMTAEEAEIHSNEVMSNFNRGYSAGITGTEISYDKLETTADVALQAGYEAGLQDARHQAAVEHVRSIAETKDEDLVAPKLKDGFAVFDRENAGIAHTDEELAAMMELRDSKGNALLTKELKDKTNSLGKVLGMRVYFHPELEQNGYINEKKGEIHIALNADEESGLGFVIGHEFTHRLEKTSPKQYEYLTNAIRTMMESKNVKDEETGEILNSWAKAEKDYKALIQDNIKRLEKNFKNGKISEEDYREERAFFESQTDDDISKEIVSDHIGKLFKTNSEVFDDFLREHLGTKEGRTLLQKLRDFFRSLSKKISDKNLASKCGDVDRYLTEALQTSYENVQKMLDERQAARSLKLQNIEAIPAEENTVNMGDVQLSARVTDPKTVDFLENQEHIKTYKAMQVIDGKLYPPMAAKVKDKDGKWKMVPNNEIGAWMQAVENLDGAKFKKNGQAYYVLDKADGSRIEAAYNPYEHSSNLVLNDQFESAYKRDNLVVVECEIPTSEMNGTYHAPHAKDATGMLDWKSGCVAKQLKDNQRKVYLSRWLKPVRVLSDAETASLWAETLKGENVSVPFNVVWPGLLSELEKVGIKINYNGSPSYQYSQNKKNSKAKAIQNKNDISYSYRTENFELPKGGDLPQSLKKWAKNIGLDTLTKQDIKGPVIVSVKDLRSAWYKKNGRSEEAEVINKALDSVGKGLTKLAGKYNYIDLTDALDATVHYRTNSEGKPTSVILSCKVKNAEYEVNFDFTTICSKRLAMQKVIEKFIKTEGKNGGTLYDELKLDEEGMYKLRLILEAAGFEVSCRGCFVEQNRYSQQSQARTVANDWNAALDAWAEENGTEITENFNLTTLDTESLDYDEIERGFKKYHELMQGLPANVETKNRMLIESSPFFRKRMNPSDYASLSGQKALMAIGESKKGGTSLYGLLKRGQSDSKQSVPFTAYNGEVALLPDKMKNMDLRDYLYSIGGARAQSASDFQIEFLYDYMQLVADLSARDIPMHMYTKVIELAELFGMTGIKINLSAMCDVDPSVTGEYAGLKLVDGKYEYNISDQSIDYDKATKLQKKDGYSKNIGIIMVVLSKQHMLKSLDDPDVRYIIGYHSSAMPVVVANMSNMGGATDYTKLNKTGKLTPKGRKLFEQAKKEANGETELERFKDALRIFEDKIQQDVSTSKKKRPRRGNEYGTYVSPYKANTADFNTYNDLKNTNDARRTADNYISWCMDNDYIPMYFPFAYHENYYKCEVYDFNMYDNVTGEYAPMQGVQNIYPGLDMTAGETDTSAFMKRVSKMMNDRNKFNEKLSSMYDPVFNQAKNELRITGDDYMDFDASGIEHSELTHRADAKNIGKKSADKQFSIRQRDTEYMDAVNRGDMETAQRMVDEAAKRAGYDSEDLFHGTNEFGFSEFDLNKMKDKLSIFTTTDKYVAQSYVGSKARVRDIADAFKGDVNNMSAGELVETYNKMFAQKIYALGKNDRSDLKAEHRRKLQSAAAIAQEIKDDNPYSYNEEAEKDIDRMIAALENMSLAENLDDFVDAYNEFTNARGKVYDLGGVLADQYMDSKMSMIAMSAMDQMPALIGNSNTLYGFESERGTDYAEYMTDKQIKETIRDLKGGIYKMRGKTTNMLEINGDWSNWNNIRLGNITQDFNDWWVNEENHEAALNGYYPSADTRTLSAYAKARGYEGLIITDVYDSGGYTEYEQPSDLYVYFDSSSLKSTDPVTYDDNGNVIPLSERFNDYNPDIRYSMRNGEMSDDEWLDALDLSDIISELRESNQKTRTKTRAKRRVDEVNKRLKSLGLQFTGTTTAAWTDERIDKYLSGSYYGSTNPNYAQAHIAYITPQEFLNLTVGSNTSTLDKIETESAEYGDLDLKKIGGDVPMFLTIEKGKNGAKVIGHEGRHRMLMLGKAGFKKIPILIFDSTDKYSKTHLSNYTLKAERWNRDDFISTGRNVTISEMIPFSQGNREEIIQKFGSGNTEASVRYSLRGSTNIIDHAELVAENTKLQKRVENLEGEFHRNKGYKANKNSAKKALKTLMDDYGVDAAEVDMTADQFTELANKLHRDPKKAYQEVRDAATKLANDLIINSKEVVETDASIQEVKDMLRKTKLYVDPTTRSDIPDFNEVRKSYFGKLTLTYEPSNQSIDDAYSELSNMYPWLFPEEIMNSTDQLEEIMKVVDTIPYLEIDRYSEYDADTVDMVTNEVMNSLLGVLGVKNPDTFADRKYKEKTEYGEKIKSQYRDRIARIRQQRDAKIARIEQHNRDVKANAKARATNSEARKKLLKLANSLKNKKTTSFNKALINQIMATLDETSASISNRTLKNLSDLDWWVRTLKSQDEEYIVDSITREKLERFAKIQRSIEAAGYTLNEVLATGYGWDQFAALNGQTLEDVAKNEGWDKLDSLDIVRGLTEVLLALDTQIRNEKRTIDTEDRRDTFAQGMASIDAINNSYGIKSSAAKLLDKWIFTEVARPRTELLRICGYNEDAPLYQRFLDLTAGQRKMVDYSRRANERYFDRFINDKEFISQVSGKKAREIEITGEITKGNPITVKVTPDLLMSLYMHSLNDQNTRHMEMGGVTIPDIKLYKEGKIAKAYDNDAQKVTFTRTDIKKYAMNNLTPKELAFINSAQKYYKEMSQPEINAVSEKLLGYEIANVENYYRIVTDKNWARTNFDQLKMDGTIEGMGFTKERIEGANNPMELVGMISQVTNDIKAHSKYVGMAIPVRNFNKVYGISTKLIKNDGSNTLIKNGKPEPEVYSHYYSSVMNSIKKKWGDAGNNYIIKMLQDIQNPNTSMDKTYGPWLSKVRSNYAKAVLDLNAAVAIKQAASYPTAAAELGWEPLMKALTTFPKTKGKSAAFISQYSPLMRLRTEGYISQETGDILSQGKSLPKAANWIQMVDIGTVRLLWLASEYKVKADFPNLKYGTKEFYEKVGELHTTVIENTQPNYTELQRAQILRSDKEIVKMLNMFKTQPFQNMNILMEAFGNYRAKNIQYKNDPTDDNLKLKKDAAVRVRRAVTSQFMAAAVFAAMQFVWDLFRGRKDKYKDKEGEENLLGWMRGVGLNMVSSFAGMLPFGTTIAEWGENTIDQVSTALGGEAIFDQKFYGMDAGSSLEGINDILSGATSTIVDFIQIGKGLFNASEADEPIDWEKYIRDLTGNGTDMAQYFGVPVDNIMKSIKGVISSGLRISQGKYVGQYYTVRMDRDITSATKKYYWPILLDAYDHDPDQFEQLYNIMIKEKKFATKDYTAQQNVDKKIRDHVKELAKKGKEVASEFKDATDRAREEHGIDSDLYKAALEAHDANQNDKYDQDEIYAAIASMNLTDAQKEYLWSEKKYKKTFKEFDELQKNKNKPKTRSMPSEDFSTPQSRYMNLGDGSASIKRRGKSPDQQPVGNRRIGETKNAVKFAEEMDWILQNNPDFEYPESIAEFEAMLEEMGINPDEVSVPFYYQHGLDTLEEYRRLIGSYKK